MIAEARFELTPDVSGKPLTIPAHCFLLEHETYGDEVVEFIFQKVKSGEALLDGDTYFPSPEDGSCSYDPKEYWEFGGDIELCL